MNKVWNLFARAGDERRGRIKTAGFREPTLYPPGDSASSVRRQPSQPQQPRFDSVDETPARDNNADAPHAQGIAEAPADFAGIVAFFKNAVASRKSPFNTLTQSAEKLRDYIPDEIGRLKAAYALCREQLPADALALAIDNHIVDIERMRDRAKKNRGADASNRLLQARAQAGRLAQQRKSLEQEINALRARLAELEASLASVSTELAELDRQRGVLECGPDSSAFVDQAAENLKNDLLAKKILLGLR